LAAGREAPRPRRYRVRAVPLGGVRGGLDLDKARALADALEDEEMMHKMERRRRASSANVLNPAME